MGSIGALEREWGLSPLLVLYKEMWADIMVCQQGTRLSAPPFFLLSSHLKEPPSRSAFGEIVNRRWLWFNCLRLPSNHLWLHAHCCWALPDMTECMATMGAAGRGGGGGVHNVASWYSWLGRAAILQKLIAKTSLTTLILRSLYSI